MKNMNERIALLGIPLNNLNMEDTVQKIIEMTDEFKKDKKPRLVITANVDFVINVNKKQNNAKQLLSIIRKADLVTADGMPLVWLSRLIGSPLKERVAGSDMALPLAKAAAENGKSIYLLGGKDGSAGKTAQILKEQYPDLVIAGYSSPYITLEEEQENVSIINDINAAQADILLIALGNPKQELFFELNRHLIKVPVSIGVGGTFEFIAGTVARAPQWIQKLGLEWIYRLLQEPKRLFKRYMKDLFSINLMIFPLLMVHYLSSLFPHKRENAKEKNILPFFHKSSNTVHAKWTGFVTKDMPPFLLQQLENAGNLVLDFHGVRRFSAIDGAQLIRLTNAVLSNSVNIQIKNLRFITKMLMRVNRVFDLLEMKNSRTEHQASIPYEMSS